MSRATRAIDQAGEQALLDRRIDLKLSFGRRAEQLTPEPIELALGRGELCTRGGNMGDRIVVCLFQRGDGNKLLPFLG